ncbi:hypothetical protein GCM10010495_49340 [Kitasatospora herbaricolor]|uniref:peptidoglycan-binding domain-containing protein n=1 Tax=Kitasatospora herbaricolor TaxID=68217 RepID=UPI00174B4BF5|nr:peptidoglycan-binding domain-containing protein [Kitasatospora herbaricolor]MDQ0305700.1 peptidoglycan hydrolase-like protein with peptidoglycan-binding domain [Kitasatospora herbaricolor]GGV27356.1 hypothetical protein GCM10010495_49340 [Kitasatospora herbaricolor]
MRKKSAALGAVAALFTALAFASAAPASAATSPMNCGYWSTQEPELSFGDSGAPVQALQCELNSAMANTGLSVDGKFGGLTYNAVVKFQGCAHLDKDGIVGPKTWAALDHWSNYGGYIPC